LDGFKNYAFIGFNDGGNSLVAKKMRIQTSTVEADLILIIAYLP
jgi:hypothetical protein